MENQLVDTLIKTIKADHDVTVVTLCGSCKFKDYYNLLNVQLSIENVLVFSVASFGDNGMGKPITEAQKISLDTTHKLKIRYSDAIVVINPNNYIGESTASEIEYADSIGKIIYYLVTPE